MEHDLCRPAKGSLFYFHVSEGTLSRRAPSEEKCPGYYIIIEDKCFATHPFSCRQMHVNAGAALSFFMSGIHLGALCLCGYYDAYCGSFM